MSDWRHQYAYSGTQAMLVPIVGVLRGAGFDVTQATLSRDLRELGVLKEFCRFSELMQAQAAAGWPDIAGPPHVRKAGQELIDDCR